MNSLFSSWEFALWDGQALSLSDAALRIAVAAILGLVVGIDRKFKRKPIGLRSYMLVAIGAACFAMLSLDLSHVASEDEALSGADVSRVIQGLIGAMGFLGAGAIIQSGEKVVGTATAAAIWCVGAISLAVGFGFFGYAILVTLAAFMILAVLGYIRARLRDDLKGEFLVEEHDVGNPTRGKTTRYDLTRQDLFVGRTSFRTNSTFLLLAFQATSKMSPISGTLPTIVSMPRFTSIWARVRLLTPRRQASRTM